MENSLETFSSNVFQFITGGIKPQNTLLVKKHSENLQSLGDFSFPNTLKPWHEFLDFPKDCDKSLLQIIGKEPVCLIQASNKWILPVVKVKEYKDRIHMFLDRCKAIQVGLLEAMKNNNVISQNIHQETSLVQVDPLCEDADCTTSLRLKYLTKAIQNLYAISITCKEKAPKVLVTSKSSSKCVDRYILCGVVINAKTGVKETAMNSNDFLRIRQDEMTLIAQHKYGVRVSTDTKWREFIAHLGESAVIFELLQTKPSSAVKINFDCSSAGSSKGAAFILYNCARLETIIRTYNDKVEEGKYPPLPTFGHTDFTLLTQEDEWNLVFNYLLGFPTVLNNCVEVNERTCEFRPHQVCSFLCSMVRVFSQYYRKIRILTEPRQHLLPVMFARIHMLMILNDTLKICLRILNIKSVSQM